MEDKSNPAVAEPADHDIATAPGDIAMPAVESRFTALRHQFRHDNTTFPLAPQPGEPVRIRATSGTGMPLTRTFVHYTVDGSMPDRDSPAVEMQVSEVTWDSRTDLLKQWEAELPGQPAGIDVRYRVAGYGPDSGDPVWAHDGQGFWFRYPGADGLRTFAYPVRREDGLLPEWMRDAVIYHIFVDRFHPGTPEGRFRGGLPPRARHGGNLHGIIRSLPYLADLGVTCLWLSPIHPSETYHRYDGTDFCGIDPDLGSDETMHQLVDKAHDLGMRIWLDFVPSHSSWHHPAFVHAQTDPEAPTRSWYTFSDWPSSYRCFLEASRNLPTFNLDDPGARAYIIDAAVYWLREFDVDGFRLDHAIAPGMDFWVAFRRATEAARSDVANVGEATDTPDCLRRYRGKLHGILDFDLARALRLTFGRGGWQPAKFDAWLTSYERYMSTGPGRVSFLDNHDMDRFLWVAGNDISRLKLAALCQFTLSPTPVIYYGTEIGLRQQRGSGGLFGGDELARGDMLWDPEDWDEELLAFFRTLIGMRRSFGAVRRGTRRTVHVDDDALTYAYVRTHELDTSAESLLVVLNMGDDAASVPIPDWLHDVHHVLSTFGDTDSNGRSVRLPARSGAALAGRRKPD